jgi:transposase
LKGSIPSFIHISDGKMHDVKVLDILCEQGYIEAGAFYVMDKAYVDFARLYTLHMAKAFFVTRAKTNMQVAMVQSFPVATNTGLISDHHVRLAGVLTAARYPEPIRLVLQMDQTAPSNQSLLWQHGKCREDANMDRDCDLRLDCNYEEAIEFETFALRNPKSIGLKHV